MILLNKNKNQIKNLQHIIQTSLKTFQKKIAVT